MVYELILDSAPRRGRRLHVITNVPLRNYIERNAGEALSELPIVCLIYKMFEKLRARARAHSYTHAHTRTHTHARARAHILAAGR
jgi:hypothetical protein